MLEHTPGGIVAGRYRLSRALAQGAMGSVWVARHMQLDVDVAIKFMAPQFASSADLRARFEREAKAAAMLKSPNAVQVYDYGVQDGSPYIVMELLEGEDLQARLARERRLSLGDTLHILEQVGKALHRAHELGLVHRDLKPANIFLARHSGERVVKVVDFGIAKSTGLVEGAQATRTGALLGSPSYMSPEQVRSSTHVDHRTDLWSLGVIAFECVTGRLPFPGDELGDVLVDVCTAPIPLASQVAPDLGAAVDGFFQRALARDPGQRFQSGGQLVEAFAALPGATLGPGTEIAAPNLVVRPAVATLSPSAQTRPGAAPPSRGRRTGILIGAAIGAAALALGLVVLLRGPAQPDTPSAPSDPAAALPAAALPAPAIPPPASPAPEAQSAVPAPSVPSSAPAASASSRAPAPPPRSRPPVKAGRPSPTPPGGEKSDDLLKHM